MRLPALVVVGALAAGCGGGGDGGDGAGTPEVRTADAGTVIVGASDEAGWRRGRSPVSGRTRLAPWIPTESAHQRGERRVLAVGAGPRGASLSISADLPSEHHKCGQMDSAGYAPPIYWREDPGNWGSAVVRDPIGGEGGESLAEHGTSCRIFVTEPTGVPEESSFNEATDEPLATVSCAEAPGGRSGIGAGGLPGLRRGGSV